MITDNITFFERLVFFRRNSRIFRRKNRHVFCLAGTLHAVSHGARRRWIRVLGKFILLAYFYFEGKSLIIVGLSMTTNISVPN